MTAKPTSYKRIPELDGMRGAAVLWVVFHNVGLSGIAEPTHFGIKFIGLTAGMGWIGVQMFFVLSGFLITGILLDKKGKRYSIREFYVNRALRIFPLYYVFLVVCLIALPSMVGSDQVWYWTYTSNWNTGENSALSHLWSLAIEEQFYLVWPFIVVLMTRKSLVRLCTILIIIAPITRLIVVLLGEDVIDRGAAYTFTFCRFDSLGAGALLAIAYRDPQWRNWVTRKVPIITSGALLVTITSVSLTKNFNPTVLPQGVVNQTLAILLSACLLALSFGEAASRPLAVVKDLLKNRSLTYFAKYSYAIYLIHYPIGKIYSEYTGQRQDLTESSQIAFIIGDSFFVLFISTLLAVITWHLIESPCLNLRQRTMQYLT